MANTLSPGNLGFCSAYLLVELSHHLFHGGRWGGQDDNGGGLARGMALEGGCMGCAWARGNKVRAQGVSAGIRGVRGF